MRKVWLFALMMALFPLAGCGGGEETAADVLPLSQLSAAEMEGEVVCHYEQEIRTYTLSCAWTPESARVTVLAPEEAAGISAVWDGETAALTFGDMVLDAGSLSGSSLSPASVLPAMAAAIRDGYPLEQGKERLGDTDCRRITYDVDEGKTLYSIWYTEENVPVRCEVEQDGRLAFEVAITAFSGEEEGEHTDEVQPEKDLGGD